jgi:hypothetical protein
METIVIKPKNKQAIAFLKLLLSNLKEIATFEVINTTEKKQIKNIPNSETVKTIKEIKKGKVFHSKNHKDLMKQLND